MEIYIDGDASPIIDITISLARKYKIPINIVKNQAHYIDNSYANIITVDVSSDSADFYIFQHIKQNDILISQDMGLIALVLSKNVYCLDNYGRLISNNNIDLILNNRHISSKLRREKKVYSKFKKRNKEDDLNFKQSLENILSKKTP